MRAAASFRGGSWGSRTIRRTVAALSSRHGAPEDSCDPLEAQPRKQPLQLAYQVAYEVGVAVDRPRRLQQLALAVLVDATVPELERDAG